MPRFYFHLHNDDDITDDEGQDLPDMAAVRLAAFQAAADIIGADLAKGGKINPLHSIEVKDDSQRTVFALAFRDLIGRE